jgi:hypothetical protein
LGGASDGSDGNFRPAAVPSSSSLYVIALMANADLG